MALVDEARFRRPEAGYRPVAMWFWNGDLTDEEVRRQIAAMAAGGVGGIQIAARTGLTTPYLSERWFALVGLALDEARRQGLEVWLADEYPYPSGASGGEVVLRHPEYRAWQMRALRRSAAPGEVVQAEAPGTVLLRACAVPRRRGALRWEEAVPLEAYVGLTQTEPVLFQPRRVYLTTRRYLSSGPRPALFWRAPEGAEGWDIWLIAAAELDRFKFFGAYVDLCNPNAVRFFLETTHRRYLDRLGPRRFAQLAGFFLDEAHPQNWSWGLPEAFRRRCAYDLGEALPALWTDVGPRTAQIRYDYHQTLTELFVEGFHRPVAAWCREHGVRLSLEVGSTRNVVQRHADVPGIDPGHEKVGEDLEEVLARELPFYRGNLTFPASLAAQTGKGRVLDELFHSVGWSLTLQDMKAMLDRAAARGANLFACHAFCSSVGGLRKWDAPPSEFDQNPYWPHFPHLAAYAGRLAYALSRGRRVAPLALLDPITSLWAHGDSQGVSLGAAVGGGEDELARRLAADWTYLMRELAAAQRPHDTLDPLLLAEAAVEGGALRLGEAAYRVVVLPPLTTLERAAWQRLEAFAQEGGTVVACGLLPCEQIEPGSDVVARCGAAFGADPRALRRAYEQSPAAPPIPSASAPSESAPSEPALSESAPSEPGWTGSTRTAAPTPQEAPSASPPGVRVTRSGGFVLLRTEGPLVQAGAAGALLHLLDTLLPPDLRLTPAGGASARRHFLLAQRREGAEDLFFLANASMEEHECEVALPLRGGQLAAVTRLDLETGEAEPLTTAVDLTAGEQRLRVRFPRHGSHLLLAPGDAPPLPAGASEPAPREAAAGEQVAETGRGTTRGAVPGQTAAPTVVELALAGEWRCAPAGDNALRLDRFRFATTADMTRDAATGPTEPAQTQAGLQLERERGIAALSRPDAPLVEPKPLVNVLQDLERAGRPWPVGVAVAPGFGAPPELRLKLPLVAWYAATFTAHHIPPAVALCLEVEALQGDWDLWINGHHLGPDAFRPRRRWDTGNREAEVAPLLRPGSNELLLRVRTAEPSDGLVDALYLLGDFAVGHDPRGTPLLTERPERVRWEDLRTGTAGYPYFAGTLRLSRTERLPAAPGDVVLRLPDEELMFAGVAELSLNGRPLGVRPWAPYAWTVPAGALTPGAVEVTLAVTNTLVGLLEGKRYDPRRRRTVPLVAYPGASLGDG